MVIDNNILANNINNLKEELSLELSSLLSFWALEAIDNNNGGFIGEINHFGEKNSEASKGVILNTRILWTFSAAFRTTNLAEYKAVADRAYNYLINHFWDAKNEGLIWEVDYLGNPLNSRKQAYAQGFGIYAFSEYYRATQHTKSLNYANSLYEILENKFCDKISGGYIEALKDDWSVIKDMRLSDKDQNSPKSMNTHLHIIEPYVNLYRINPSEKLKQSITALLEIFNDKIIDKNTGHFNLFFGMDWEIQSTAISFGHDIEGAWLLHEAALIIGDENWIKTIRKKALQLVEITIKKGLDIDGSLFNEFDNGHMDTDKHWWPQAEAMVGLMDAYEINHNEKYLEGIIKLWNFIKFNLKDKENGEWYWRVDENGNPITSEVKVGFWKCPYHNGRALMELIERIEKI
ncbi:mannobiose 2-epimerase [Lutibacter agarilyticus]|uniref:Cellobiose 2-epimerase n=1 Tax=Lutibacter agarilyticus TaxID=1109740 RepID=A0A238WXG1_9FLAO|nr:AGE family epimerase/isomerase [Lutibacter agarilyticus]SNR51335.1 mannobiose 2-epimerase [Lutibacter agarilyticus]